VLSTTLVDRAARIAVDRAWIGAPVGTWANPTVWLLGLSLAMLAAGGVAYVADAWPAWAIVLLDATALYVIFTPLHESMHGIAHADPAANEWIGRVSGALLTIPLPLFRAVHHEHHSHTNDRERDPDYVVARRPRVLLPLWCIGVVVKYRWHFYARGLWRTARGHREAIAYDLLLNSAVVAATSVGLARVLLVLWIGPALLAVLALAFWFDFVPHYPYDTDQREYDTRLYGGAVASALLLGQSQHLIHHLWTTIPWFRYRAVVAQIRAQLVDRGCRVGWRVKPLPDGVRRLR
jgi:beta-carotene hydroxylase